MRLRYELDPSLPALGYLGTRAGRDVVICHGTRLETTPTFFADGVWAGPYAAGPHPDAFISGTAGVLDDETLRLQTPFSPADRIFVGRRSPGGSLMFSNSLPVILSALDDHLDIGHRWYRSTLLSADLGVRIAPRTIPTARGNTLRVVMAETVRISSGRVAFRPREPEADFADYAHYREHLAATVQAMITNAGDPGREHRFAPLTTISSGYDSSAVAVLASEAGVRRAVTLLHYGAHGERIDYPDAVVSATNLDVMGVERDTWRNRTDLPEAAIAAAGVTMIGVAWLALEPHMAGALLLTGSGARVWLPTNPRTYRDVVRASGPIGDRGLAEHRLRLGYAMFPVPTIGQTALPSIARITHSAEMQPWRLGGTYDRPIARRIIEEAGIPRGSFATSKHAASANVGLPMRHSGRTRDERRRELLKTMGPASVESFLDFVQAAGIDSEPDGAQRVRNRMELSLTSRLSRVLRRVEATDQRNAKRMLRWGIKSVAPRRVMIRIAARARPFPDYTYLLPHWGTSVLRQP